MSDTAYGLPYVPKGAWLEERYVRCGKLCRCQLGETHGTYWRLCWREYGSRRQRYISGNDVAPYQEALELRRKAVTSRRSLLNRTESAVKRARAVLRATA